MSYPRATLLVFAAGLVWSSVPAAAQPVGAFRWQLQPYCNVLTLVVTHQNGVYTIDGTDDRCDDQQSASAVGVVFLNPNGTVGFGVTTVLPGATPIHLEATIDVVSLTGTWRDSSGNSGSFVFTPGAGNGGNPRPIASAGVPAGSITTAHLANGAVGASAIAANAITGGNVIDGTLTGADLAPGAIGGSHMAPNSVNGANIQDGTLTRADIGDAPRAAAAGIGGNDLPPFNPVVVVSLPFSAPPGGGGNVIVNASGSFDFGNSGVVLGRCSITTGTTVTEPISVTAQVQDGTTSAYSRIVPFVGTRMFSVAAGSSTTFNLVCYASSSSFVWHPVLTALFIAGP